MYNVNFDIGLIGLNTDYLFPIISVLFFLEIYCRGTIDKRK